MSVQKQKALALSVTALLPAGNRFLKYLWLGPLTFGFAVWEVAARLSLIPSSSLPAFSSVLVVFFGSVQDPAFLYRIAQSFLNLTCGLLIAFAFALPTAFLAGCRNRFDYALTPIVMLFGALPDLSFLPLLVLWFGSGNAAAITMAAVVAFFPIYFTVREGTKSIPRDLFDVTSIFHSGRVSVFTKMALPAISPQLFSGLRLAYDFDWEIIIAIEIATRVAGIGSFIEGSVAAGSLESGFAAILGIAIVAIIVDRLFFGSLESWARKWS